MQDAQPEPPSALNVDPVGAVDSHLAAGATASPNATNLYGSVLDRTGGSGFNNNFAKGHHGDQNSP